MQNEPTERVSFWNSQSLATLGEIYRRYPHLLDDVRLEPGYHSSVAVIPDETAPSGTFRISGATPEIAAKYAAWHRLDQQKIPHVHSERSLKLKELRQFSGDELNQRAEFVRHKRGNRWAAQRRMVHRVQNERSRQADAMLDGAKRAQAQLVEEAA